MTPVERLQRSLAREGLRAERDLELALDDLASRVAAGLTSYAPLEPAQRRVARIVSRVKALGDMSGRLSVRFPRSKGVQPDTFAVAGSWEDVQEEERAQGPQGSTFLDGVPSVTFDAAVRDMESRDPWGAEFLKGMGVAVADMYGPVVLGPPGATSPVAYPHGFAASKAATADVAARVQARLTEGLRSGRGTEEVAREIAADTSWTAAYSRTITRTNFNTATTAGRFTEAREIQGAGFHVGFRYMAVTDSNVRRGRPQDHGENHLALDGLVARIDDPIWKKFSPPGGYQCRCTLSPVVGDDVPKEFVQAPAGAAFAPGFGTRGDLATYG